MAFVFRSQLKNSFNNSIDANLGPGQYLPVYQINKIPSNKTPFLSSLPRNTDNKKIEEIPGPGSYHTETLYDQIPNIFLKNKKSQNFSGEAIYKALENNKLLTDLDPVQIWVNDHYEKLGFLTKTKRFNEENSPIPGPGSYIKMRPNSGKQLKNSKEIIKKAKLINTNNLLIETIPAKKHLYGFDLDFNGSLVRNSDPEFSNKYKGEKNDSVGPANYTTLKPYEWHKKGTSLWSKSKTHKYFTLTKSKYENNQSKTFYKSNDKEKPQDNIDRFKIRISKSFDGDKKDYRREVDIKILKEKTKKTREKLLMNHTNKLFDRSYLLKTRGIDFNPGPGYYYDEKSNTGFKSHALPEEKQVFGSNCQRFPKVEVSEVRGPGYYNNEFSSVEKIKQKEFKEKILIPQMAKIKKYKPIKVEETELPGPGQYFGDHTSIRVKTAENNNFGSTLPRFQKFSETTNSNFPGPGSYLNQSNWNPSQNNNLAKIFLKPILNTRRNFSIIDKKPKDQIPPIGTYNPDYIYNLDYKVAKNCAKNNLSEAPFNLTKSKPRFENQVKGMSTTLGPGLYFKEQIYNERQKKIPFSNGERRFRDASMKFQTSPGQYESSSYFDWNRKTFNILYV